MLALLKTKMKKMEKQIICFGLKLLHFKLLKVVLLRIIYIFIIVKLSLLLMSAFFEWLSGPYEIYLR